MNNFVNSNLRALTGCRNDDVSVNPEQAREKTIIRLDCRTMNIGKEKKRKREGK